MNDMIWERVPKEVFVGRDILEFGMYDAIAHFNMGSQTVILVYEALGIESGKYTREGCKFINAKRIEKAEEKKRKRRTKSNKSKVSSMLQYIFRANWCLYVELNALKTLS